MAIFSKPTDSRAELVITDYGVIYSNPEYLSPDRIQRIRDQFYEWRQNPNVILILAGRVRDLRTPKG